MNHESMMLLVLNWEMVWQETKTSNLKRKEKINKVMPIVKYLICMEIQH